MQCERLVSLLPSKGRAAWAPGCPLAPGALQPLPGWDRSSPSVLDVELMLLSSQSSWHGGDSLSLLNLNFSEYGCVETVLPAVRKN